MTKEVVLGRMGTVETRRGRFIEALPKGGRKWKFRMLLWMEGMTMVSGGNWLFGTRRTRRGGGVERSCEAYRGVLGLGRRDVSV